MSNYKLGSLFDESGGFPLAGALCGVEPMWAAEVEPYPIAVTRSRFPNMRHLGDISKVNGAEIEPVDIITFGSPCQDLSVAGKRAGLKHEANGDEETTRSGLFMEAVRIIKEMRRATNGKYPRFALWENVPGAFSSNKGEDFRIVCEELIKIVEPAATMPPVPQNGWAYADSYVGDGWSLGYRILDAQYWGVPQRRRRIYLVADFRGECAHQVLFEREGLRGYFAEGRTPWQTTPADAQGSTGADDREGECTGEESGVGTGGPLEGGGTPGRNRGRGLDAVGFMRQLSGVEAQLELSPTLLAAMGESGNNKPCVAYSFDSLASNSMKSSNPHSGCREVDVAKTLDTTDPNPSKNQGGIAVVQPVPYTLKIRGGVDRDVNGKSAGKGALIQTDLSATLGVSQDQYLFQPVGPTFIIDSVGGQAERGWEGQTAPCLKASHYKFPPTIAVPVAYDARGNGDGKTASTITGDHENRITDYTNVICMATQQGGAEIRTDDKAPTITAAAGMSGNNQPVICLQGNGIDRADTAGCNGKGWKEDTSYTLNNIDRPAVVYGLDRASFNQGQNAKFDFTVSEEQQPTLTARGPGAVCCATDVGWLNTLENQSPTLLARQYKDPHLVTYGETPLYIVRRLTPTECARLQGFADWWGHVEKKKTLTEEEFRFWLEVRNTHARINGKTEQDYTVKQMLTWYNKLWTDSAEYKMWGNGIALPTALYVVQGIVEVLKNEEDDAWML